MISRGHRFRGYNSLRQVYRHGATVRGPLFALKVLKNPRRRSYRVAVVVSRKVHKSAVARNRMRRRLYELVRALESGITEPYDIVMTVFHDTVLETPSEELNRQLKRQLIDAGVLNQRVL